MNINAEYDDYDLSDQEFSISLREFTETNAMERIDGTRSRLLGEYHTQDAYVVKESIKTLVRSMAMELNFHHEEGYCLSRFDEHNFKVAASGHVKIRFVTRLEKSKELVEQNFANLHYVVVNIVLRGYTMQQIPPDWRSLLELMLHRPHKNGYLICNYAALIPLENRMLFVIKAYEHIKFFLARTNENAKDRILKKLPYAFSWSDLVTGNHLLKASFDYKGYDVNAKDEIKGKDKILQEAEMFLDYYRHTNCHRMDRCFLIEEVGGYSGDQFEMIFIVKYPLYLPLLQQALHEEEQLQCLKPHTLFFHANVASDAEKVAILHDQHDEGGVKGYQYNSSDVDYSDEFKLRNKSEKGKVEMDSQSRSHWTSARDYRNEACPGSEKESSACTDLLAKPAPMEKILLCSLKQLYNGAKRKLKITRNVAKPDGKEEAVTELLDVEVLPGCQKGTKLLFPNKGSELHGRPPQDLIFVIDVKPHDLYVVEGNDLVVHQVIPLVDALARTTISLKTLDGQDLHVRVEEVVHPGHEIVIENEGWPINDEPGRKGNLKIRFDVAFPTRLSSSQQAAIRQIMGP